MRCGGGRGGRAYLYRLLGGVWVVLLGASGLDKRLEMGDPFGAIMCGVGACEADVLLRVGDAGVSRLLLPSLLPPSRGVELHLPRLALDSKLTIVMGETKG